MRVAVLLQIANGTILPEILSDVSNLAAAKVNFDLYVSLADGMVDTVKSTDFIHDKFPNAVVLVTENRGFDIGPFVRMLALVFERNIKYDLLLKLHTKSARHWRRQLIEPLCGSVRAVQLCLQQFQTRPKIGMLGARQCIYWETLGRRPNGYYLSTLSAKYGLKLSSTKFVGGTMFWARMAPFYQHFKKIDGEEMARTMNNATTHDPHWYTIQYRHLMLPNVESARHHWLAKGKREGYAGNCLWESGGRNGRSLVRDGMIEHGMERLFGLLMTANDLEVVGI